jgi:hypothetical protein
MTTADASGPVVWVVNRDHWPRAYLRAELIERGYDAIGFGGLRDALGALPSPRARRPRLVVIDLEDEPIDDRLLRVLGHVAAPVVGVVGAVAAGDPRLRAFPWAALLRRPVTLGAIADAVGHLLPVQPAPSPRP